MFLDRWRARRAIATRTAPSPVADVADPRLRELIEAVKAVVDAPDSLGDPSWHQRWDGELQLVGLDARTRSVTDVRQRLARLAHECDLRHLTQRRRRVLAVVLCDPRAGEDLRAWHARVWDDQGEIGVADWRAVRGRIAVLAADTSGQRKLIGGAADLREALARLDGAGPTGSPEAAGSGS